MQVMSSITVSFSFHFWAAALTMALPACSGLFFKKNGQTILATYSFDKNSQTPSDAITKNLSDGSNDNCFTSGSHETPMECASPSPRLRLIARPGVSS